MSKQNNLSDYETQLEASRNVWNQEAPTFDEEADHGLRNPIVRAAWKQLLSDTIKVTAPAKVLDIGCGTGSLSILLSELGYEVTGIDLSPAMIDIAKQKTTKANHTIQYHVMDAAFPKLNSQKFDLILCRHLLWALPEPKAVLERWSNLLNAEGQLILIEGFWHTGGGLHSHDIIKMMPTTMTKIEVQDLSDNSDLWATTVTDERYLIHAILNI